jgi:16S rRNA (cytidine1402-2'-O)-methyltransferase
LLDRNLYIVSTPIGNVKDFSPRGIEVLENVDIVLCEDTRVSLRLFNRLGIRIHKLAVYNDHNAMAVVPKVVEAIKKDHKKLALVTDAGTPTISDPGYRLINACLENDIKYTVIPGACAAIAALTLSGLPSDKFLFCGFADPKKFDKLAREEATIILYEAPHRLLSTLKKMEKYFGDRVISISREITKIFEETVRGDLCFLLDHFEKNSPRGEFVLVISPRNPAIDDELEALDPLIRRLIGRIQNDELSRILAEFSGLSKNKIYRYIYKKH